MARAMKPKKATAARVVAIHVSDVNHHEKVNCAARRKSCVGVPREEGAASYAQRGVRRVRAGAPIRGKGRGSKAKGGAPRQRRTMNFLMSTKPSTASTRARMTELKRR